MVFNEPVFLDTDSDGWLRMPRIKIICLHPLKSVCIRVIESMRENLSELIGKQSITKNACKKSGKASKFNYYV